MSDDEFYGDSWTDKDGVEQAERRRNAVDRRSAKSERRGQDRGDQAVGPRRVTSDRRDKS